MSNEVNGTQTGDVLAAAFERERPRLRGIAFRMLGTHNDADDAVQEAWLRLQRTDAAAIDNLGGWLTTVVSRVCLDQLRSRGSRPEQPVTDLPEADAATDTPVVEAFLAASREGDFGRLLQVLDPEVELRADPSTVAAAAAMADRGAPLLGAEVQGADAVARVFAGRAGNAQVALIDGVPGAAWAPGGKPRSVFAMQIRDGRISRIEVIADRAHLAELDVALS